MLCVVRLMSSGVRLAITQFLRSTLLNTNSYLWRNLTFHISFLKQKLWNFLQTRETLQTSESTKTLYFKIWEKTSEGRWRKELDRICDSAAMFVYVLFVGGGEQGDATHMDEYKEWSLLCDAGLKTIKAESYYPYLIALSWCICMSDLHNSRHDLYTPRTLANLLLTKLCCLVVSAIN